MDIRYPMRRAEAPEQAMADAAAKLGARSLG